MLRNGNVDLSQQHTEVLQPIGVGGILLQFGQHLDHPTSHTRRKRFDGEFRATKAFKEIINTFQEKVYICNVGRIFCIFCNGKKLYSVNVNSNVRKKQQQQKQQQQQQHSIITLVQKAPFDGLWLRKYDMYALYYSDQATSVELDMMSEFRYIKKKVQ
ncbi:hypothetical protein RND81_02G089800 [Saponaria officinalis]|uniref:Uncharacterized protein n=1 Tax=Saponaria officinalis TaxID=3572 RepID=A0AAW1MNN0_SAPOF